MNRRYMLAVILILAGIMLSASGVQAQLAATTFTDALGSSAIDTHWLALNSTPTLVSEAQTIPSNDGKVMKITSLASGASNGLLVNGTEAWQSSGTLPDITASVWMLPNASTSGLSEQGVIIDAATDFSMTTSDHYYTAFLLYYGGSWSIRATCNCPDVQQPFPGWSFIDVPAPGNPGDGAYHQLKLQISHSADTMTVYWDGQKVGAYSNDSRITSVPGGRVGVFANAWAADEIFKFDNFQASWDNNPQLSSPFTDALGGSAINTHWLTLNSTPTLVSEAQTIPSNDGKVMQITSLANSASNGLLVNGTEAWQSSGTLPDTTAAVWMLPNASTSGLSEQGVIIDSATDFSMATTDNYYTAYLLYYGGSWSIRATCNCPQVQQPFPGWPFIDVPAPGNPADGAYHQLKLQISHSADTMTVYWDGQKVGAYSNDSRITSVPGGRVGVFANAWAADEIFKFDNFQASWDNEPQPVPPPPAHVPETKYQQTIKAESSLIGYYTFDNDNDTSVRLIDVVGGHNSVAKQGSGLPYLKQGGVLGSNCMKFDGNGWFDCGSIPAFTFVGTKTGSIEFWAKISSNKTRMGFVSTNTGSDPLSHLAYQWQADTSVPCFVTWDGRGAPAWTYSGTAINDSWHQIDIVYSSGQTMPALYVDGQLQSQNHDYVNAASYTGLSQGDSSAVFVIGNTQQIVQSGGENLGLLGEMDELSLYSQPLTAAQIRAHYQAAQVIVAQSRFWSEFE